jgi:electron transfer flavoprotein alpha subunit
MAARFVVSAASVADLQRLAHAARELAGADGRVDAVVLMGDGGALAPAGAAAEQLAAEMGGLADTLVVYDGAGTWLRGDVWAAALLDALGDGADGVFVADAPAAREAIGRVAAARGSSCAAMCDVVTRADDGRLVATRSIYGGVADGTISLPVAPAVCLFAAGTFEREAGGGQAAVVEHRKLATPPYEITSVGEELVVKTVDLAGASVVVAVGRGFAKAEDLEIVQPLLRRLGAELGCSRPIAEDFKWLPQEHQVGLTGASVSADLYLAFGISGQVQHLAGVKGARIVVAVNKDARAPIMRNADYVLVNDLYKVIPELLAALGNGS